MTVDELAEMPLKDSPLLCEDLSGIRARLINNSHLHPHHFRALLMEFADGCRALGVWHSFWFALDVENALRRVRSVLEEARGEVDVLSLLKAVELENAWLRADIGICLDSEDEGSPTRMAERAEALAPLLPRLAGAVGSPHLGAILRENLAAWAAAQPAPATPGSEGATPDAAADHPAVA